MAGRLPPVSELLFGKSLAWSGTVLVTAIGLGQAVRVLITVLDRNGPVPTADPTGFPGVLFLLVLPLLVGVVLWRNRGVVPSFALTFVPVLVFYRIIPQFLGGFVTPAPIHQAQVYHLATLYWVIGAVVALALYSVVNSSGKSRGRLTLVP